MPPNLGVGEMQLPYKPPLEPEFKKVTYLELDPPRSLNERIERLIHAIYVDVPPEYDHYGHEIRRYMAKVAGPNVLNSKSNLQGQIQNIESAQTILKYWKAAHEKETADIEKIIEETDASSSTRQSFKYRRGVADAFFIEAGSWMNNNKRVLKYLHDLEPDSYEFKDPTFTFSGQRKLKRFLQLYDAQQRALKEIQDYTPFRMMVY